jgi:hypothetical protein
MSQPRIDASHVRQVLAVGRRAQSCAGENGERPERPRALRSKHGKEACMATPGIWSYRETRWAQDELVGLSVEAIDGSIGKIDEASNDVDGSYVVVDTGPWIFGKKVMLPAGVIQDVDLDSETVFVNRTKDQIKNAPEYDRHGDDRYRDELAGYYGPGGMGYRDYDV